MAGPIILGLGAGGGVTGAVGLKLGSSMSHYSNNEKENLQL